MNKLTKEDCLKAIEKIEESFGCDMAYYDLHNERDLIKHLINEHFELKEKYEKLVDKATPKKGIVSFSEIGEFTVYECSSCGNGDSIFKHNYCSNCGQRLDWREDND